MADEILHFLRISTFPHHSKAPSTAMDYCTADDPFVQYEHLAKSWEHSGQSHRWKKQLKAPQSKKTAEGGVRKVSYSSENQCPEAAEGIAQHRGITCLKWQGTSFKSNAFAASHVRAVSDRIKRVVSKRQAPHLLAQSRNERQGILSCIVYLTEGKALTFAVCSFFRVSSSPFLLRKMHLVQHQLLQLQMWRSRKPSANCTAGRSAQCCVTDSQEFDKALESTLITTSLPFWERLKLWKYIQRWTFSIK